MKEQIEEIWDIITTDCDNNCGGCKFENDTWCFTHYVAEHLYNAGYRKQEWISVDDRLPENDYGKHWKERQHYLVMTEPSGLMRVARFGNKEFPWWIDSHDTVVTTKVTHWMPLPEPPKMKGNKEEIQ